MSKKNSDNFVIGKINKNEVIFDSLFILVDQTPLDKVCEWNIDYLEEIYGREPRTSTSFDFCKEGLEKSNIHDYWIIKKKTDEIYGPYGIEEYYSMRKELKIPKYLRLESEM